MKMILTPARSPAEYVGCLEGWQARYVQALRDAVLAAAPQLEERLKWGHLVFFADGPVLMIRAEPSRVLFGFWRGQRLRGIEPRLKPGGKFEMATLELREDTPLSQATVTALAQQATRLNESLGDPGAPPLATPPAQPAGYSGTPLASKLGIKPGQRLLLRDAPAGYLALLAPLPAGVGFVDQENEAVDLVQLFVTERGPLAAQLTALRQQLRPDAVIWVSWPKKASKRPTTISEDLIRELALPLGYVDIKVCAVDAVWSGLKLVLRKALR